MFTPLFTPLWSLGSLQLLGAVQGQESPVELSYGLRQTRFTLAEVAMRGHPLHTLYSHRGL